MPTISRRVQELIELQSGLTHRAYSQQYDQQTADGLIQDVAQLGVHARDFYDKRDRVVADQSLSQSGKQTLISSARAELEGRVAAWGAKSDTLRERADSMLQEINESSNPALSSDPRDEATRLERRAQFISTVSAIDDSVERELFLRSVSDPELLHAVATAAPVARRALDKLTGKRTGVFQLEDLVDARVAGEIQDAISSKLDPAGMAEVAKLRDLSDTYASYASSAIKGIEEEFGVDQSAEPEILG